MSPCVSCSGKQRVTCRVGWWVLPLPRPQWLNLEWLAGHALQSSLPGCSSHLRPAARRSHGSITTPGVPTQEFPALCSARRGASYRHCSTLLSLEPADSRPSPVVGPLCCQGTECPLSVSPYLLGANTWPCGPWGLINVHCCCTSRRHACFNAVLLLKDKKAFHSVSASFPPSGGHADARGLHGGTQQGVLQQLQPAVLRHLLRGGTLPRLHTDAVKGE